MSILLFSFVFAIASDAAGTLVGVSSDPVSGERALTLVSVDSATGKHRPLLALDPALGYFDDSAAATDDAQGTYFVALAGSTATSSVYAIDIATKTVLRNRTYAYRIASLAFDSVTRLLYAIAPCAGSTLADSGDCAYTLEPDTLGATPLASLPGGWLAMADSMAVDERIGVLYVMTANMYNASVSWSTVWGIDVTSRQIVSAARHPYGQAANEIIFSLYFDPQHQNGRAGAALGAGRVVALCSGTKYTPGKQWAGYYLAALDLTGDTVVATAIGAPAIFGGGWPAGYSDAYPAVQGFGSAARAFYCAFFLKPAVGGSRGLEGGLGETAWLLDIDLDSGAVRSTAKGFPLDLVDLQLVGNVGAGAVRSGTSAPLAGLVHIPVPAAASAVLCEVRVWLSAKNPTCLTSMRPDLDFNFTCDHACRERMEPHMQAPDFYRASVDPVAQTIGVQVFRDQACALSLENFSSPINRCESEGMAGGWKSYTCSAPASPWLRV
jgi:hypothetical protein